MGAANGCCSVGKEKEGSSGICPIWRQKELSEEAKERIKLLFKKLDLDGTEVISMGEAMRFFKGKYGKLSAKAMFNEVDVDHNGNISEKEWLAFWVQVFENGYTEQQILEEVEEMMQGGTWVDWKDNRDVDHDVS
mmetsp:Transcript_103272/g.194340  ORF Transcript_103272/g.194340 Transcript_103272/m.194340 type:complete len:135 (-) Transcript_103272:74-478(-)